MNRRGNKPVHAVVIGDEVGNHDCVSERSRVQARARNDARTSSCAVARAGAHQQQLFTEYPCDPQGVGKTSLITAAATESFPDLPPPVLPPTRLPAEATPENVPMLIMDSSSRDEEKTSQEVRRLHHDWGSNARSGQLERFTERFEVLTALP